MFDNDECDRAELAAQDRHNRHYQHALIGHPQCNDPDHPGCESCEPTDDDE